MYIIYAIFIISAKKIPVNFQFHGHTRDIRRRPSYWLIGYWYTSDASISLVGSSPKI